MCDNKSIQAASSAVSFYVRTGVTMHQACCEYGVNPSVFRKATFTYEGETGLQASAVAAYNRGQHPRGARIHTSHYREVRAACERLQVLCDLYAAESRHNSNIFSAILKESNKIKKELPCVRHLPTGVGALRHLKIWLSYHCEPLTNPPH